MEVSFIKLVEVVETTIFVPVSFLPFFLAPSADKIEKLQIDHTNVCDYSIYFRQHLLATLHLYIISNHSIFEGLSLYQLAGRTVHDVEVALSEGSYLIDLLHAEGPAVRSLA